MLDDRSYMREPDYRSHKPAALILVWVLVGVFVFQSFALRFASWGPDLYRLLSLTRSVLTEGHIWQLLTFQFLHAPFGYGGLLHIFFNCLVLYMFGTAVEGTMGRNNFLKLYFFAGIMGGLLQAVGNLVAPGFFRVPVVGASAGVSGIVAAFAILMPSAQIMVFGLFPITARTLLIAEVVLSVFGILFDPSPVAHGAHLGGIVGALVYMRFVLNSDWKMPSFNFSFPRRKPKVINGGLRSSPGSKGNDNSDSTQVNAAEIDAILDKISAHGIQSLTEKERQKLQAARARMARR